jgi:hypothetical protein
MNLIVATLALATAEPVAQPPAENEIEVIGNRLREWRGKWKTRKGVVSCRTTRSTGDKAIDAIGCDAMVQCVAPVARQWAALDDEKLSKDELNRRANAMLEEARIGDCMTAKRDAAIAALAAARRSNRT